MTLVRGRILSGLFIFAGFTLRMLASDTNIPQRIVSLGPPVTQALYVLGVQHRLIADTVYCTQPEDARHKTKIGNVTQVNIEKIVSLKPDLVIATSLTRPEQIEKIRALGITTARFTNPNSFRGMCDELLKLGGLVGKSEEAERIVELAAADVERIRKSTSRLPRKRVFVQLGSKPLFTVTRDSFINDYITFAGGENISEGEMSGIYSREKVIEKDPEVIIISTMGMAGDEEKEAWLRYPVVSAVKTGNIHVMDSYRLCSPTPVTFADTLREIARMLNPTVILP